VEEPSVCFIVQEDELDQSGSVPAAVEGDTTDKLASPVPPAAPIAGDQSSPSTAPNTAGDTSAAAGGAQLALADKVKQLQDITGVGAEECLRVLQQVGGDVDAAAGQLMGF
jgi:UBA-like domain